MSAAIGRVGEGDKALSNATWVIRLPSVLQTLEKTNDALQVRKTKKKM